MAGSIIRLADIRRRHLKPLNLAAFAIFLLTVPAALMIIMQIERSIGFGEVMRTGVGGYEMNTVIANVRERGMSVFSSLLD